ncbi:MAG: RagB/SusD family nutrient uptake outer membrane protein, partial [Prevotella sp.]
WSCWGWESDNLYYQQWFATVTGDIQNHCYQNFSHYQFLSKARNTIRRIEQSSAPESAKRLYVGEVEALRGWMALYLYDMFGTVPVASDDVLDTPTDYKYLARLTDEEYDQMMENDLRDAIDALPEKAAQYGRMTKGAARMILLKYYMMRGKWQQAETLARDLAAMEGTTYSLLADYNSIFTKENEGNKEIILAVPCVSTASWCANSMTAEVLPSDMPWTEKSAGWGGYVMPWAFYDTFEQGDSRTKNIYTQYTNTNGVLQTRDNNTQLSYGALPLKYGKDPDMSGSNSGVDLVIYRFSDVLLTLAEAITRNQGQPTQEAINLVNRVRNRAGLPDLDATKTASTDEFLNALLAEREHEFWMEGLSRQDQIRFGQYVKRANERIEAANAKGKSFFTVTDAHNRFWIPESFISESKNAIKQNEGY